MMSNMASYAVVPNIELCEAEYPRLATLDLALNSPLPLGIAVFVEDTDCPLPLYFVSEAAASTHEVESAWYVVSEPGERFHLFITNFHEEEQIRFWGKQLARSETTCYSVLSMVWM